MRGGTPGEHPTCPLRLELVKEERSASLGAIIGSSNGCFLTKDSPFWSSRIRIVPVVDMTLFLQILRKAVLAKQDAYGKTTYFRSSPDLSLEEGAAIC